MSSEPLLKANKLSRSFNGNKVVNDVDISLQAGEVLGILGPNGAGKTTTLKMLAGVLEPQHGEVIVCNETMTNNGAKAKRHIGYLPEDAPLYGDLTVDEYLHYCAGLRLLPRGERGPAVEEAKQLCDLSDVGDRLIGNLSKGFKQRIGIAQAIIHKPPVLILDEPTNGLDPNQIRDVRTLVRSLAAAEQGLIISTHVLSEVQALCDRVVIIHRGRVAFDGSLEGHSHVMHVTFAAPVDNDFFDGLPGIRQITNTGKGNFAISVTDNELVANALIQQCVKTHSTLLEMTNQQNHLEQLFFDITCNDFASGND